MKMFPPFFGLLVMVVFIQGETVWHNEIGLMSNDPPYWSLERPISFFPQSPEEMDVQFFLFTINNRQNYQVVSVRNLTTFQESNFDVGKKCVFIVHGYTEKGDDPWLVELCQKILERHDVNCFCVDWRRGASAVYFQAMNNVQVAGGEITFFVKNLVEKFQSSLSGIYLIGHSLGAQAVGEAGKRLEGIPLIIALDAARPGFENESPEVSIDSTDADVVIAIHTDAGPIGIGMKKLFGSINILPNGGEQQTGCNGSQIFNLDEAASPAGGFRDVVLCNHVASYYMYISSFLIPGGLMGYCASSYSEFLEGAGFPCTNESCFMLGYNIDPGTSSTCSLFFLNTGPRFDYQRWRCKVTANTNGDENFDGSIEITLFNSTNGSEKRVIYSGPIVGGSEYSAFIDICFPPPIPRVTFSWRESSVSLLQSPRFWADFVTVIFGHDGSQFQFCGEETTEEGVPQTLNPCP